MSTSTTHERSIHIDAPVARVFEFVKDPRNTYAVICETPTSRIDGHVKSELTDVTTAADGGVGTTWSFTARLFLWHFEATFTREEYVPDERIVDRNAAAGYTVTFGVEPDPTGTTLTLAWGESHRVPLLSTVWDHIYWDGDHDLDAMLGGVKKSVETDSADRHDVRT